MSLFLLIVAVVIAALIVYESKWPNIAIVPVTIGVIAAWYVALWVLKVTLMLLVPVVVIAAIVYGFMHMNKKAGT